MHPLLEGLVGRRPGRGVAGLAGGLLGVGVQPLTLDRPCADGGLPEQVRERAVTDRGEPLERARTSSPRFVSCVESVVIESGQRR
jgi:hypothetical protein